MKKILSYTCALLALIANTACNKGEQLTEAIPDNSTVQSLTINATLPNASGEGMRAEFSTKDHLYIRFSSSEGEFVGAPQTLSCESADGKNAVFSSKKIAVHNAAEYAVVYLDNKENNLINYGSNKTYCHLNEQKGTLEDAVAHQVILARVPATELRSGSANASLEYKTSIVKFVVTFPEEAQMLDKDGSAIVPQFTLSSQSLYNDIQLDLDTPTELSSLGALTVPASQVDAQTNTAVAYVALWPKADDFTQSRFIARLGTTTYGSELATLKPAVARTSEFSTAVETKQYNVWFNDDENTIADVLGGVLQSVNWIRKDGNSIVVEENKTGRMRTGTIELDNGVSYIVTQLGPNMFKGVWTLRSRRFNPNGTAPGPKGTTSAHEQSVSFGEPRLGETLVDADGKSHTNNIGITGLYGDAVLEACVDIDYENRTIAFGIFFDRRKAQSAGNGKYVAILPELAAASCAWTGYNFAPGSKVFSDNDYEWLWFNIDEEFKTLHYVFYQKGQLTSNKKYSICGISCVAAKGEDASTIGSAYDVIYQANYNGSNADGLKFLR